MDYITQEPQEFVCGAAQECEPCIAEHPIIIPIVVIDGVLPDISSSIRVTTIGGMQLVQIVEAAQELNIV
jgi:hypothetical protein